MLDGLLAELEALEGEDRAELIEEIQRFIKAICTNPVFRLICQACQALHPDGALPSAHFDAAELGLTEDL